MLFPRVSISDVCIRFGSLSFHRGLWIAFLEAKSDNRVDDVLGIFDDVLGMFDDVSDMFDYRWRLR